MNTKVYVSAIITVVSNKTFNNVYHFSVPAGKDVNAAIQEWCENASKKGNCEPHTLSSVLSTEKNKKYSYISL